MKRIVGSLLFVFLVVGFIFAQGAPKKILSSRDVSAFITNFAAIESDLEELEDVFDGVLESAGFTDESTELESFETMRTLKMPAEIQAVFKKHGMGSNGFEKMVVITTGYSMLEMDEQMKLYADQYQDVAEMEPFLEEVQEVTAALRNSIHDADYTLIESRKADLKFLLYNDE